MVNKFLKLCAVLALCCVGVFVSCDDWTAPDVGGPYVYDGERGEEFVEPIPITAVTVNGFVSPVASALVLTAAELAPVENTFTVESLTWIPSAVAVYESGIAYTAYVVLKANSGYKFSGIINPVIDGGGTILGGSTISDDVTLTFIVAYPPTSGIGGFSISGTVSTEDLEGDISTCVVQLRRQSDNQMLSLPVNPVSTGSYTIGGLLAGNYKIEFRMTGYKTGMIESIVVGSASITGNDIELEKGAVILSTICQDDLGPVTEGSLGQFAPSASDWTSSDTNVARVSVTGVVEAVNTGTTTITVSGSLSFDVKVVHFSFTSNTSITNNLNTKLNAATVGYSADSPISVLVCAEDSAILSVGGGLGTLIAAVPAGRYVSYDLTEINPLITSVSGTGGGRSISGGQTRITSVILPPSVTSIGVNAFQYFSGLKYVVTPTPVTSIGVYAFYGCSSLTTMGRDKDTPGIDITSVGNAGIADYAFSGCSSITTIEIPSASTFSIGMHAFENCTALKSITYALSNGTNWTSVGEYAFAGSGLETITIPTSITSIPTHTFYNCHSLKTVTLYDSLLTIGISAFSGSSSSYAPVITSLTIPQSVKTIGDSAFYNCRSLATLIINSGATTGRTIGPSAFSGYLPSDAPVITRLNIPSTVETIGSNAFKDCHLLNELIINDGVETIGNFAFSGSSSSSAPVITSLNIPQSVKTIGDYAFYNCYLLGALTIDSSGTTNLTIGDYAFSGSSSSYAPAITSLNIPARVTSIGASAFYNCSSLTSLTIASGTTTGRTIGISAFSGSSSSYAPGITSLYIPGTVTTIGAQAFYNCNKLATLTIADGVKTIGPSAFSGSSGSSSSYAPVITSLTIPQSVTTIGASAFANCNKLSSLALNDGLQTIGSQAFSCTGSSIGSGYSNNAPIITDLTIPKTVTTIGSYSFSYCPQLTALTIDTGSTPATIGDGAFYNCTNLAAVSIPGRVTSIGISTSGSTASSYIGAFANCTSISSTFSLNNGLKTIGACTFYNSSVPSLTIPASVEYIYNYAFYNCTNFTTVTMVATTPPTLGYTRSTYYESSTTRYYGQYNNFPTTIIIKVPSAHLTDYRDAPGWGTRYNTGPSSDPRGNSYYSCLNADP